jgi:hypothetical protein
VANAAACLSLLLQKRGGFSILSGPNCIVLTALCSTDREEPRSGHFGYLGKGRKGYFTQRFFRQKLPGVVTSGLTSLRRIFGVIPILVGAEND